MLLLNRTEISNLLELDDYIKGVEDAFRLYAEGKSRTAAIYERVNRKRNWAGIQDIRIATSYFPNHARSSISDNSPFLPLVIRERLRAAPGDATELIQKSVG